MHTKQLLVNLVSPKIADLGEFSVRRLLPSAKQRAVGPWVFFDHMGPVNFKPGPGVSVRPHPHINLATVTYLFEGEILHRDSLGHKQLIHPGDINLMVAGSGIVHSERESEDSVQYESRLHGLQLWLALPESEEETTPQFLHYPSTDIPTLSINGVTVTVMMGRAFGMTSPVKTFTDTLYLEACLGPGQQIMFPDKAEELAVYVAQGCLEISGEMVSEHTLAILNPRADGVISARENSRIVFIGGTPVGPRFMWWNFISSRKERIEQAKLDWREGRFDKVPGDELEYIPLPEH